MNVLFLCHRLPFPPKRGGKIRPFNIIRHLSESGHRVTVGSIARSAAELADGEGLVDYCDRVLVGQVHRLGAAVRMAALLPTATPSSMGYFYSRSLHRQVAEVAKSCTFDLVFVHCSSAAQYAVHAGAVPSIIDFGDMDSQKWLDYARHRFFPISLGYRLEGIKLLRAEKRLARRFDLSTCTTKAELDTLNGFSVARRTDWFPNGVDSQFFSPADAPYNPDQICFVGRMDYYPNQQAMVYFCGEVWPRLKQVHPELQLKIVGAEPSAEIRRLRRIPGVEVTGTVPDVRPFVQSSVLTVAPLAIARGTQNKILESMAMGVPVVCSDVASRGVNVVPGKHLLVANSVAEYSHAIAALLTDRAKRDRLARAGRDRVLTHHSWAASMKRVDEIIDSLPRRCG